MENNEKKSGLCPFRLGLAGGVYCGLVMFLWTLFVMKTQFGEEMVLMIKHMWPGYELSIKGAFVGLIYGFIKGFVSLFIIAWIYDLLLCCSCCKKSCKDDGSCNSEK